MQFPAEFKNRMSALLGDEYDAFEKSFESDEARTRGLRISCRETDAFLPACLQKYTDGQIPWCANGFYSCEEAMPGKSILHEAGAFYLQEPSAMLPAVLADVKPGEKVLDLCAAPGGKATALGNALQGEGVLVANEIHPGRAAILSENIERMGISNALVLNETPEHIAELFPEFFDVIVVDAPCSGEGMFRKEEAAVTEWSPENVTMCADRQKDILREAVKCLKYGGRLVYSTCTFAPAEDEENVAWLLNEFPELSLSDIPEEIRKVVSSGRPEWADGNPELQKCVRLWPHLQKGEGHFAALFKKSSPLFDKIEDSASEENMHPDFTTESKSAITQNKFSDSNLQEKNLSQKKKSKNSSDKKRSKNIALSKEQRDCFEVFAKETFTESGLERFKEVTTYLPTDERVAALFGDNLYIMPFFFSGKGVRIMRAGLHVGTFAKNRFEPSMALARTLTKEDVKNVLPLTEQEKDIAIRYIQGEQLSGISPDLKGWTLVTYEGYSLGFGKASGGVLKNHYPKGLRKTCIN